MSVKCSFVNNFCFGAHHIHFFFGSKIIKSSIQYLVKFMERTCWFNTKKASSVPTPSTLTLKKVKKARNLSWSQCVKVQFLKSRKNFDAYIVGHFGNKQHDLMAWHINSMMLSRARPYIVKWWCCRRGWSQGTFIIMEMIINTECTKKAWIGLVANDSLRWNMVNYTTNLKKRTLEPSELPSDVNY